MPRRKGRAKTSPETLKKLERQRQAFELRKQGYSFSEIAARLKVDPSTAHGYVTDEMGRTIPKDMVAQLAVANLARLEEVVQINHEGMRAKDQASTTNYIRAVEAINRMVGARGGDRSVTINNLNLSDTTSAGINWDIERSINFVKPPPVSESEDGPQPGDATPYSARVHQFPRLIEGPANDPAPEEPKPAVRRYERQTPDDPPSQGDEYAKSFAAREPGPNEARTEFELPLTERFGFSTDDGKSVFGTSKKRKTQ